MRYDTDIQTNLTEITSMFNFYARVIKRRGRIKT